MIGAIAPLLAWLLDHVMMLIDCAAACALMSIVAALELAFGPT